MKTLPGVPRTGKVNSLPLPRKPTITLQPRTYKELQKGIDVIANAVRPTLGPLPRITVLERLKRTDVPEFLDDGAMIARRIIEIIELVQAQFDHVKMLQRALFNAYTVDQRSVCAFQVLDNMKVVFNTDYCVRS